MDMLCPFSILTSIPTTEYANARLIDNVHNRLNLVLVYIMLYIYIY